MDKIKATFELNDGISVEGVHDPAVTWNGFAVPYFTHQQATELLIALYDLNVIHSWSFVEDGDYFEIMEYDYDTQFAGSDGLYPIGGYMWVWSVVE